MDDYKQYKGERDENGENIKIKKNIKIIPLFIILDLPCAGIRLGKISLNVLKAFGHVKPKAWTVIPNCLKYRKRSSLI